MRKILFSMLVFLPLMACSSAPVVESKADKANRIAYDCAVALRAAAFLWKEQHPDESGYPSIFTFIDPGPYHAEACDDANLTKSGGAVTSGSFKYETLHAEGSQSYVATESGVSVKKI